MTTEQPPECQHLHTITVSGFRKCAKCDVPLPPGICLKCLRALDNHNLKDDLAPICPKVDEMVAP